MKTAAQHVAQYPDDHCSFWSGIPQEGLNDFHRKAIGILVKAFRTGVYNLPINWDRARLGGGSWPMLAVNIRTDGIATYDFDRLTRLVIAAHDECVRVEVSPSAPRYLKVSMWPRKGRDGSMMTSHPTIEDAISDFRRTA